MRSFMPINTRNVIIDDRDVPNNTHEHLPDYDRGYYNVRPYKRYNGLVTYSKRLFYASIALCVAFSAYVFCGFAGYVSRASSETAVIDIWLIALLKIAVFIFICAILATIVNWFVNQARQAGIVRLQNNQPVAAKDITTGWSRSVARGVAAFGLDRFYATDQVWAEHSTYRNLNTLDVSNTNHPAVNPVPADQPLAQLPPTPAHGSTIEYLRQIGYIDRSGKSLLVGTNDMKPRYIELAETGFIAVAGQPRVGKTSTVKALLAQAVLMQWLIFVCDKHGNKEHGLLNQLTPLHPYLAKQAIAIDDIIQTIDRWYALGKARLAEDVTKQYQTALLVIDEFTGMILLEQLPDYTLAKLVSGAVEFPKVNAHGLIVGHSWTGKLLGPKYGAQMRRATTHRIIHRCDPQDAEFLLPSAYAKRTQTLAKGSALFAGADEAPIEVAVPFISAEDLSIVARIVGPRSPLPVADPGNVSGPFPSSTKPGNSDVASWSQDQRIALARILLRKREGDKYKFTIRQIQDASKLRTATIVALSREVRGNDESNG